MAALSARLLSSSATVINWRAGTPPTTTPGGTSRITTAPAATTDPAPTVTPGMISESAPMKAPAPIVTGATQVLPMRRLLEASWQSIRTPGASVALSSIVMCRPWLKSNQQGWPIWTLIPMRIPSGIRARRNLRARVRKKASIPVFYIAGPFRAGFGGQVSGPRGSSCKVAGDSGDGAAHSITVVSTGCPNRGYGRRAAG